MPKSGGWRKGKGNSVRRRWKPEPRTRSTHSTVPRRAPAKVIDKRQFGDLQKANSSRRVTLQPSEPRLDLVPPKQRVAYKLLTRYDTCRQVRTDVFQKCTLIFVSRQRRRGGGDGDSISNLPVLVPPSQEEREKISPRAPSTCRFCGVCPEAMTYLAFQHGLPSPTFFSPSAFLPAVCRVPINE